MRKLFLAAVAATAIAPAGANACVWGDIATYGFAGGMAALGTAGGSLGAGYMLGTTAYAGARIAHEGMHSENSGSCSSTAAPAPAPLTGGALPAWLTAPIGPWHLQLSTEKK